MKKRSHPAKKKAKKASRRFKGGRWRVAERELRVSDTLRPPRPRSAKG
jgi:hypothetical protein